MRQTIQESHRRTGRAGSAWSRAIAACFCLVLGVNMARGGVWTDGVEQGDGFTVHDGDHFNEVHIGNRLAGGTVSIAGGVVEHLIVSLLRSAVSMSGGTVGEIQFSVPPGRIDPDTPRSFFNITGGEVMLHRLIDETKSFISGGRVREFRVGSAAYTEITGGSIDTLELTDIATALLFGRDFNFPLGDIAATSGTLTGILNDGSALNMAFTRGENATLRLVPEPGGLGVVLLGVWAVSGRGRRSAGPP